MQISLFYYKCLKRFIKHDIKAVFTNFHIIFKINIKLRKDILNREKNLLT
jgi:hypothetical protein